MYNAIDEVISDFINRGINAVRPYNKEKRDLQSYVNFRVISKYFADKCLEDFKDREHKEALKINKEMN